MADIRLAGIALVAVLALTAGCSGGDEGASPVDAAFCSPVVYEGEGDPDAIIVSDVPRFQGPGRAITLAMVRVIEAVLRQRSFRAGQYRIGYQSCVTNPVEPCDRSARAYAAAKDVLGVIGPYFSDCASVQIPILSRKAIGPLAMVSPTNTDPGLTLNTPYSDNDPGALYSDGVRNYVRVVPSDVAIGAAAATLAKQIGAKRVVAFVNREPLGFGWYGPSAGGGFVDKARSVGLIVTEFRWRAQESYESIAKRAAAARPQLVFFAGHTQHNARRLLEDVRREVGPNVVFAAGDQFLTFTPEELGPVGEGLRVTGTHLPVEALAPAARRFLRSVGLSPDEGFAQGPSEAAPATEVLLDAIARSDGSRSSVVEELFETRIENGILGSFSIDRNGDITPASVALFSIRNGKVVFDDVVRVPSRVGN